MRVVHDLLADVDRRAVELERLLDGVDRPLDAGAVAPGRGEKHAFDHRLECITELRTVQRSHTVDQAEAGSGKQPAAREWKSPPLGGWRGGLFPQLLAAACRPGYDMPRFASPSGGDATAALGPYNRAGRPIFSMRMDRGSGLLERLRRARLSSPLPVGSPDSRHPARATCRSRARRALFRRRPRAGAGERGGRARFSWLGFGVWLVFVLVGALAAAGGAPSAPTTRASGASARGRS